MDAVHYNIIISLISMYGKHLSSKKGVFMKKIKLFIVMLTVALILFLVSGCSVGGVDTVLTQEKQDEYTAYGLVDMFWFIWNQNIAGQPVGTKDFTVDGPLGGTIHVTGYTEYSSSTEINTLHLVCEMTAFYGMRDEYDLQFTGTVNVDGTFSDTYKAVTHTSSSLSYSGSVGTGDFTTEVSSNGSDFNIAETRTVISGTIDGRNFSWGE